MKLTNKILEAINRGIKFALDDFEDNEQIQGQVNSKVSHQHGTKEYLDLMNEVVDLGLPSGTLWCKYNLDVDPNQLSKVNDWNGKYYAWGELEPNKLIYDWDHYKHGYGPYDFYTYVNNKDFAANDNNNKVDNLTELLSRDDAAYQFKKCHNFKFHIPTKEQFEELLKYTQNYWVNNYDPNKIIHNQIDDKGIKGLNGRIFEGRNGNTMFIPAAGWGEDWDETHTQHVGFFCSLWSSSLYLDKPYCAWSLRFNSNSNDNIHMKGYYRYHGFTIRPVINL